MARVERLDRLKDLISIDNIVKRSNGAYTHDEVWFLNVTFVNNLTLMYYEQDCYTARRDSINKSMKEQK
jgi:hypothetical protein